MQADISLLLIAITLGSFVYLCTTLGSASVFIIKQSTKPIYIQIAMGFSAGIMIAASIFSLLLPAIESSTAEGFSRFLPVIIGFVLGVLFLILIDKSLPHLHLNSDVPEGPHSHLKKQFLLFNALTIHNIPEGMALGITAVACYTQGSGMGAVLTLAVGIGIQNIPEGAAISLPFFTGGMKRLKAFVLGSLSGIVEPIAAVLMVVLADHLTPLLPWFLAFASGAMLYVVIEELIPQSHGYDSEVKEPHTDVGTVSVLSGFLLMTILDNLF